MADAFEFEVATPERLIVQERVTEAQIPARDGYIGVLPGHAPLVDAPIVYMDRSIVVTPMASRLRASVYM